MAYEVWLSLLKGGKWLFRDGDNLFYVRSLACHYMMKENRRSYLPGLPSVANLLLGSWFTWLSKKNFGNFVQVSSHTMKMIPYLSEQGKPISKVHEERLLSMKYLLTKRMCTESMHKEVFVLTVPE